jgi:hypothetical protein
VHRSSSDKLMPLASAPPLVTQLKQLAYYESEHPRTIAHSHAADRVKRCGHSRDHVAGRQPGTEIDGRPITERTLIFARSRKDPPCVARRGVGHGRRAGAPRQRPVLEAACRARCGA